MDQEIIFDDDYILSETDEKGNITFVSQSFCDVSGYNREELIHQPHNIVRHSDMPKAAFAMLWSDIVEKGFWQGIVKNRSKHGDYYWVHAIVLRNIDINGKISYCSIRTQASRQQIAQAEALYQTLT